VARGRPARQHYSPAVIWSLTEYLLGTFRNTYPTFRQELTKGNFRVADHPPEIFAALTSVVVPYVKGVCV
jgi:hypothetical protein